jgi:glycosyltransferase involved in cell wall biosynthesis
MALLRILHVVPYFEGAWAYGGIPRLAGAMARGLARRGHHVTVCTTDVCDARARLPRASQPADRSVESRSIDVRVFPNLSNRVAYHYQFFTPRGMSGYLRRYAHTFDVAHVHACRNLPGLVAARRLTRVGVPYVLSPNGTAPAIERRILLKHAFDAAGGRRVLHGAARVIAVTDAERRQLLALEVNAERIVDIPNPISLDEFDRPIDRSTFRRRLKLDDVPVVLFLGKLTPRKGVEVLVDALRYMRTSNPRLVIAGNDMGGEDGVRAAIERARISHRVVTTGLLRGAERLEALASADVVVYPSRDEIFGLVPLEAMLCGTPVVVCDDSGCGEVVRRTGGGLLVPYGDPRALAAAIDTILRAPLDWRSRADIAAQRIREWFGADTICARLEELYRGMNP